MPHDHHHAPSSPSGSSDSDGSSSSAPPRTPVSNSLPLPMPTFMNITGEEGIASLSSGGVKRTAKSNRRINSAERRATHNAVERQRRETLNGRFLDLAALLVNLQQIRRPSKSAIVNSSIAHLNASRRHRILASQQLRMMKHEADALRHELNEWRARAGVPFVEEPLRGDAFAIVLRGELEFEPEDMLQNGGEGEEDGDVDGPYGHEGYHGHGHPGYGPAGADPRLYEHAAAQEEYARRVAASQMHVGSAPQPPAHYYASSSPTVVVNSNETFDNNRAFDYDLHAPIPVHAHADLGANWAYEKQHPSHHQQQQRQTNAAW
ncbi:hypothetical protein FB45DRAFT_1066475 [Roridomyces roridus]|uniref:BHLH domain-containing protein n=1 Tax=Roridomyces roridus TaxID=1738132 RepID=A0AAD7B4L4_9AGAR|nr:hypothetical protein FB45DRAFT_1066475 [Roridomyces roridus]